MLGQLEKETSFTRAILEPTMHRPLVRLLGEPSVNLAGTWHPFISDRRYQVLAFLAANPSWVTRDKLADLFYGDTNQSAARSNLRKILFKIRAFEWVDLEQNDEALRWQVESDVGAFQKAVGVQNWNEAIKHYGGSFLKNFNEEDTEFAAWLEAERLRLEELYQYAAEKYIETLEQKGDLETALYFLRTILGRDPLLETMHRRIIALEFKRGNTEAAFEQFERCRELLQKELGVEPEPETLELLQRLEQGTTQAKFAHLLKNPERVPDAPQTLFGREKLLQDMFKLLKQGERVLAQGFGGMGKTALAATLAKTFLQQGILQQNPRPVLWLQAGADKPEVILGALARPFGAEQDLAKAENKTAFLQNILESQNLALIVLDDVWNAYSLSKVQEAIPPGLPLLVTSRQRYPRIKRIYVDRLERSAATKLLLHYALPPLGHSVKESVKVDMVGFDPGGVARSDGGVPDADTNQLCQLLGDHPFALRIAGLNLREGTTVAELLERIRSAPHDLKIPGDFKETGRESVAALLSVSLETLSDLEYELFLTYGILSTPSSTVPMLAQCTQRDQAQVENALFTLVERGLAQRVSKPDSDQVAYRLHDLAHSYARTNRIQRPSTLIRAALGHLREHKHDVTLLELDIANLLSAAERCQEQGREDDLLDIMYLLTVEGTYYTARGHNLRSVGLLKEVAGIAEEKGKLEEAHYLYTKLGEYYFNFLGNYSFAFEHYQYAKNLAVKCGNQIKEAILLGLMAASRYKQGESDDGQFSNQAYALAKSSGDDECLVQVLGQLSYIAGEEKKWEQANAFLKESRDILNKLSITTATTNILEINKKYFFTLLNLGETEYKLGNFGVGLSVRQDALGLAKEQKNEVWMGYAHYEIGEMHHKANHTEEAKQHMLQALQLFETNNATKDVEAVLSFLKAGGYTLEEASSI
jgi:DNA-binding SARP family transcriptional activator/tetratricopeptide (TPR) repeat protein